MATGSMGGLIGHLRRLAADPARTDGELLDRFRTDRDDQAFAALVRRHGPMVLGVCRRILGNEADAEDAFQAVFLVLARKAHTVRPAGRVGPWLYGVASRTARKAWTMANRRRLREHRAGRKRLVAPHPDDRRELLDVGLGRLPEKYRAAVVLCDLEGATLQEVARQLNCPPGTVASRLARGRALLRDDLTRRGVAAGAAAALSGAAGAVPSRLVRLAVATAGGSVPTSPYILSLTDGVIRAMLLSKLKFAVAAVVAAGVMVAGTGTGPTPVRAEAEQTAVGNPNPTKPVAGSADPVKPVKPEKPAAPSEKPVKPEKPAAPPVKPEKPAAPPVKPEKTVKPEKPAAPPVKPEKTVKPEKADLVKAQMLSGTIKAIDAAKGTLTISPSKKDGAGRDETVTLPKDVRVMLDGQPASLGDLKAGQPVVVKRAPDGTVGGVAVEGPTLTGELTAIDAGQQTVRVKVTTFPDPTDKTKTGTEERTLKLAKGARVFIPGDKTAGLDDLKPGTAVMVRISASGDQVYAIAPQVKRADGEKKPVKPVGDKPAKPTGDKPAKPTGDKPTGDKPAKPTGDKPTRDKPAKPTGDKPTGDKPAKPTGDKPTGDKPTGDKPAKPTGDKPAKPAKDK